MDKKRTTWITYLLWCISLGMVLLGTSGPVRAATDLGQIAGGARAISLGRATTAHIQGADTLFSNPAGLSLLDGFHATSMNTRLIGEVNYLMGGGTLETRVGNVGIGYISASAGDIITTTLDENKRPTSNGTATYGASTILLSIGKPAPELGLASLDRWYIGATLKLLQEGFGGSIQNGSASGMDVDVGILHQPSSWLTIGATGKNILPASMGGGLAWGTGKKEGIASRLHLGASALVIGRGGLSQVSERGKFIVNVDSEFSPSGSKEPFLLRVGTEYRPGIIPTLALRAGLDQNASSDGAGNAKAVSELALGVGLELQGFQFDYAYRKFSDLDAATSHFFSISYNPPAAEKVLPPRETFAPVEKKYKALKSVTFNDVPDDYWARNEIETLATMGMVQGYPDGTFRPERRITRAELCALLVKAKGLPLPKQFALPFQDVQRTHWAAPYIALAADNGWVKGYEDNTFRGMKHITRAELTTILVRFDALPIPESIPVSPFPDLAKDHWAANAVAIAQQAGILDFLKEKPFQEKQFGTRSESVVMIARTQYAKKRVASFLKRVEEEGYVLERKKKPVSLLKLSPGDLL